MLLEMLIPQRLNVASPESQSFDLRNPKHWDDWLGGEPSSSGIKVTPEKAIGDPMIWRGVNIICSGVSTLNLFCMKGWKTDKVEHDTTHPAYRLMYQQPNPAMTAMSFISTGTYHSIVHGNFFAWIPRNGAGDGVELLILDPKTTEVHQLDGAIWYRAKAGGIEKWLPAKDVLHIKGLSHNGITGLDVFTVLAETIGVSLAQRRFAGKFFGNGANVGGVLVYPKGFPEKAKPILRKEFEEKNKGLDNAFRTALLEDGVKFVQTTVDPDKAQLIEGRSFSIIEIANIFGLPPHLLGDRSRAGYNGLIEENRAYLQHSLRPWLSRWTDECNFKLLRPVEREKYTHFFAFDTREMERDSNETQANTDAIEINNGISTPDEVRARRNLPPYPDEEGKKFRRPVNIAVNGEQPAVEPAPAPKTPETQPKNDADQAQRRLDATVDALLKMRDDRIKRFTEISRENCVKAASRDGNFCEWVENWFQKQGERLADALEPIHTALDFAKGLENESTKCFAKADAFMWRQQLQEKVLNAANVTADKLVDSVERAFSEETKS